MPINRLGTGAGLAFKPETDAKPLLPVAGVLWIEREQDVPKGCRGVESVGLRIGVAQVFQLDDFHCVNIQPTQPRRKRALAYANHRTVPSADRGPLPARADGILEMFLEEELAHVTGMILSQAVLGKKENPTPKLC